MPQLKNQLRRHPRDVKEEKQQLKLQRKISKPNQETSKGRNRRVATTKRSAIEVTSEGSRQKRSEQTEEDLETKTEEEASARNRRESTTKRSSIEVTSEGSRQKRSEQTEEDLE